MAKRKSSPPPELDVDKVPQIEIDGTLVAAGDEVRVKGFPKRKAFIFQSLTTSETAQWVDVIDPDSKAFRSFYLDRIYLKKRRRRRG